MSTLPSAHPREDLLASFAAIERIADQREDTLLLMTLTALRAVHNLYPQADALNLRGTPEHQARVRIHNAIVEVFNTTLGLLDQESGPAPGG